MRRLHLSTSAGFTLPELLVAVVLFFGVGVAALVLLHPNPQTVARNNALRKLDEAALMQGIARYYYIKGSLPAGITTSYQGIGSETGELDLCKQLVPTYIPDLVYDPTTGLVTQDGNCAVSGQKYHTGFNIKKSSDDRTVSITATTSEGGVAYTFTKHFL
ncbi:MAG: type II secretion system protein [Candidatus Saccharibacteria bacterium]